MYSRRDLLGTAGASLAIGAGVGASASSATAAGASFGDGVNLQPAYYCNGQQELGWDLMDQYPDVQTVRIEIEPPSMGESQAEMADAKRWIDEAYERGYDVIATYHHHPHNGSDDPADLQNAADWWVEHYDFLTSDAEFTINLMNEWGDHQVSADEYAAAYNDAIETVRTGTGYEGPIVCDVPGWGQGTHRAADAAPQLEDDDLLLSVHVYPRGWNATTGQALQPEHLDVVDEAEYPCLVGEFGSMPEQEGDADWSAVVDHASDLGWPVIGWAWNGGGGTMDMADPYWGDSCAETYDTSDYFDVIYDKLGGGATQQPPDAPASVALVDLSGGEVTLEWEPVDGADTYVVYHSDTTVDSVTATEATVNLLEVVDDGQVDHGDVANLGVAAANDADESDVTRVTVDAPEAPAELQLVDATETSATIQWEPVANADTYNVYADGDLDHATTETETTVTDLPTDGPVVEIDVRAENDAVESEATTLLVGMVCDDPVGKQPVLLPDSEEYGFDVDGDGYVRDVTGDCEVGQADVAKFFRLQHRSAWKDPIRYDFSGNGDVTHGDVVELFDYVALN